MVFKIVTAETILNPPEQHFLKPFLAHNKICCDV